MEQNPFTILDKKAKRIPFEAGETLKQTSENPLKRLIPYLRGYWFPIGTVIFLAIPMAAIKGAVAKGFKFLTDEVLVNKDQEALKWLPLLIMGLFLLNFVVRFFHFYIIRATATRVVQKLRNDLYHHIMKLSLGYFNESKGGALLSRVILDVNQITVGISSINQFVREPLVLLGMLTYIVMLNWKLALLTLCVAPPVALLLGNTGKHTKRYALKIQESLAELSAILTETFAGMRVIKGFTLENFMRGQFMVRNRELSRIILKAIRVEELARPGMELITGFAVAGVVYYGGLQVISGKMTPGDIMAFFAALALMINSIRSFGEMNIKYNQCVASAERVFRIFDQQPEIVDRHDAREMPRFKESLEFKDVTFMYQDTTRKVITNFSLKIKKGEVVALVGPSGAGKSTLLSLLPRNYDPTEGSILIDGVEYSRIPNQEHSKTNLNRYSRSVSVS